ncbi:BlaI/MecI/CopY family transcriptional regulator [Lactobacillus sp. DCY120]|uniref:BlaI/MecI/CopY family transcriptional regulator n=1 Tax=Bombilactobacillus apium TaxID=2675299 RepID=A0A850RB94_9LACO|nr:BlaI/MecI/CopY family transcriptional regulator [Bombilactobacillus apium]NVY96586.1 BlaI/MecI/CopY family transcriptional regulator [Bombilactobacillus apium]
MKKFNFTKRELQIMQVLWNNHEALSAKEIAATDSKLSQNTVQTVLRRLLSNDMIKTAGVGYSGTVLTRQYRPAISQEAYLDSLVSRGSMLQLVAQFIGKSSEAELTQIEDYIQEQRKNKD